MKVFGIRHHGVGSAKSLVKALDKMQPDVIVIEGPLDAQHIIHHVSNEGLQPPVAILIYNPKLLQQASYFPFAGFSPEWQAIKWAIQHQVPVQFMDLPQSIHFSLNELEKNNHQIKISANEQPVDQEIIHDPLGYIARLAGYEDGERWWEATFEQSEGHLETFDLILELMTNLRQESGKNETPRTLLREAHMRKIIRKAQKDYEKVAVVCGAWHAPVLHELKAFKSTADNKLLRGIKKTSTKATWVPWSYERLAVSSGYAAGIVSPAWYNLLFENKDEVVIRWMTKVAQLLRSQKMDASSAHIIEAVRLTNSLAALRDISTPGLQELYEAALTVFCNGHTAMMKLVEEQLIIGNVMGDVPQEIPAIPLQQDLEKQIKSTRMSKFKKSLGKTERALDLRKTIQLNASRLLHRLNILGIPWGKIKIKKRNYSHRSSGNFKETWILKWQPDFAISIIEAGMWGNTVEEASAQLILRKARNTENLPELTQWLNLAISANLVGVMEPLLGIFQQTANTTEDISHLMSAIPSLVDAIRYHHTRQTDIKTLQQQLDQMIPRICIGLAKSCTSLNEDAANSMFQLIAQTNYQLSVLENSDYNTIWLKTLQKIAEQPRINSLIKGATTRICYDKKQFDPIKTHQQLSQSLSKGNHHTDAAYWISGFLHGSGLILIHDPVLWNSINEWVNHVNYKDFKDILPLLRRTFAKFSAREREQMLQLAQKSANHQLKAVSNNDPYGKINIDQQTIPTLKLLLDL